MASTRPRTCSFFCSNEARSDVSESCRCRNDLFSSCKLPANDDELFEALLEAPQLEVEAMIGLVGCHGANIEPR